MRLDLGCGRFPQEGYEGVDRISLGQPHVWDLSRRPWPWPSGSVDALYCSHLVEHLIDLVGFMNEAWRVLSHRGSFEIHHPYAWSNRAWQDPTHVRALVEESWHYYDADWPRAQGLEHYPITADFTMKACEYVLSPEWAERRELAIRTGGSWNPAALRNAVNVVDDLHVTLEARK